MHTRQRTRISGGTLTRQAARAEGARAEGAWPRKRPKGGQGVPCAVWGSVAGSAGRRAAEAAEHSPIQPEGEKLWEGERRSKTGRRAIRVKGAKRLRRSRWERGTCERVARGGVRPVAGAGGYITRIE